MTKMIENQSAHAIGKTLNLQVKAAMLKDVGLDMIDGRVADVKFPLRRMNRKERRARDRRNRG